MFSAFNPSKCTHTWSSGQPTLRSPGSSWGFGALLKGLTSVVDNSCRSRDSNPQPRVTSPMLYLLGHDCRHNSSTYRTLLLLLYALPFWNVLIFTKLIVLISEACSDWPAIQLYMYCDAMSGRDNIKAIEPIINEAFVASSGDIKTDYNDLYCLFTHRVALRHVNITMSAFVIGETTNKHYSTQLKTRVWIVSGKFFK